MSHRRSLRRCRAARIALATAGLFVIAAAPALAQLTSIGLSTVRAQRFGNDNLSGIFVPAASDLFAYSLATGDFNGDGADDLATGLPYDNGLASDVIADSGSVVVRYSTLGGGLTDYPSQVYVRQTPDRDPPEQGDRFGWSLAACDFNGDGFDDLAVGLPYEGYAGHDHAGAVQIHYGSSSGLHTSGDQFFTESSAGITGDVETGDLFGWSLACGDFDGDALADLAVGAPLEEWHSGVPCPVCPLEGAFGMVVAIPGSPSGLFSAGAVGLDQDVSGMNGEADDQDQFGTALAAGNFDGDAFDDLAIGVPGEDDYQGAVQVVFGGPGGLASEGDLLWDETFIGGLSESDDYFGGALAAGDVDGDGFADLAIGIPYENFGSAAPNCGQVNVLFGAPGGFDRPRTQFWAEENVFPPPGGANPSEPNDSFGYSLAFGDFDEDGHADLAVGHPAESVSGGQDGAVTVIMGSPAGLTNARRRQLVAGVQGVAGDPAQHGEYFGFSLAAGDFDGDGAADLTIGAPYENEFGIADVGAETVLYGALFADGVENGSTNFWSQTVSSPYTNFNNLQVTSAAKLGPSLSKVGIQLNLFSPTLLKPGASTYVRVGPEAGFADERTLQGTFFIDPQSLTMSSAANANSFQLMACTDALGAGSKTRLAFDVVRTATTWSIVGNYFNELTNALTFGGSGVIANAGDSTARNNRIELSWTGGNPGHLTVWRTRFVNGAPDAAGRVLLFSVDLPGMQNAVINHVRTGMITGQDSGTFGPLYLDELSFRR